MFDPTPRTMNYRPNEAPNSWKLAAAWLAFLAPFFFIVYGSLNTYTSHRSDVGHFAWDWERLIPFIPAMIVPYMSLDLFYGGSVFLCKTRHELNILGRRLIVAILSACLCYYVFPLTMVSQRPEVTGIFAPIFAGLQFDKPYNLAPSLHVVLRSVVWFPYGRTLTGIPRTAMKFWFLLIGASTLLTYQHQAIDVISGEIFTFATFFFVPENGLAPLRFRRIYRHTRLGLIHLAGSMAFVALAVLFWPLGSLAIWPAISLFLVAVAYLGSGPALFQKHDGAICWPARFMLAPYLVGKAASCLYYRASAPPPAEVVPGLMIGSWLDVLNPIAFRKLGVTAVLDLTAELSEWLQVRKITYANIAILDHTVPSFEALQQGVEFITQNLSTRRVFVHCALGYSRAAGYCAAYLLASGIASSPEEAVQKVRTVRPQVVLSPEWMTLLGRLAVPQKLVQSA